MKNLRLLLIASLALFVASSASATTILYGTTLAFHHEYRGNEYFAQDITVGAGAEVTVGSTNNPIYTVDIEANQIRFEMGSYNFVNNRGFNGIVIQDIYDELPDFRALSVFSNGASGTVTTELSEDELRIDFSNSNRIANRVVIFEYELAAVPLPASAAFLGVAVGGLFLARRRKSTPQAV